MSDKPNPSLQYKIGDATSPQEPGIKFIIHVCNNRGGWGRGFVTALSRKWRGPETAYRSIPRSKLILGTISSPILVEPSLFVVNMIAQDGYPRNGECALDYQALRSCLDSVSSHALRMGASVHCPRIGAGLAGGDWELIEKLLIECLVEPGTSVTVYDLPSGLGS